MTSINPDIREVTDLDSDLGRQVMAIYEASFPEEERDPVEEIAAELRESHPLVMTHIRALVEGGRVVGYTHFASYGEYQLGYLKFIAVATDTRGKGFGPVLLRDAIRQLRIDGKEMTGWPLLGLVLEVERPELGLTDEERAIRQRRIGFYLRNGAAMIDRTDFVAPPVTEGQPSIPFHLLVIPAVRKYRMHRWLRPRAVEALLLNGYGEPADSWFLDHALEMRSLARPQVYRPAS